MQKDIKMYYAESDTRMEATSSDLNADLSRIQIIFADKTGTLTNNTMIFRKMGIGRDLVHNELDHPGEIGEQLKQRVGPSVLDQLHSPKLAADPMTEVSSDLFFPATHSYNVELDDKEIEQRTLMLHYLLNLLLNNELIIENGEFGGESPDEICLAKTALKNGFELISQSDNQTVVQIHGKKHVFPKIYTIKFTPDRKKMSVIVQYPKTLFVQFPWFKPDGYDFRTDGHISPPPCVCYTKGADSFMYPLLRKGDTSEEKRKITTLVRKSQEYLDEFGTEGLRTLLLCHRIVNTEDADTWRRRYVKACGVASTPQIREQRMNRVAAEMEIDLEYTGATAIEDKLQEHVPETIRFILQAGIQFWVLTGDKRQTAKNVAQLADIISITGRDEKKPTYVIDIELDDPTTETTLKALQDAQDEIDMAKERGFDDVCLVVNGTVIGAIEKYSQCLQKFTDLSKYCKTVIVCRAIPAHKAAVVKLVEKKQKLTGLAIGDGANDVSMIQAATVGIGISGKEGSQARNAADYALPRFHHLKRLLAVHGHYSLTRSSLFTQYSFYKNLVLTFAQFYFTFYCLSSGQTIIDSWVLTFYNMIFTLFPPFVMGLFEKDLDEKILEENPQVYKDTRDAKIGYGQSLTLGTFAIWTLQAIYHATIIYFFVIYTCTPESTESMRSDDIWTLSLVMSINIFLVVNIKAVLEMSYITIMNHLSIWLSIVLFFVFIFAYGSIPVLFGSGNLYWVPYYIFSHYKFYLVSLLCIVASLIPDVTLKAASYAFFPAKWQILRAAHNSELKRIKKANRTRKNPDETIEEETSYYRSAIEPQDIELRDEFEINELKLY
jgi:phospholipid-transporting ATPase